MKREYIGFIAVGDLNNLKAPVAVESRGRDRSKAYLAVCFIPVLRDLLGTLNFMHTDSAGW